MPKNYLYLILQSFEVYQLIFNFQQMNRKLNRYDSVIDVIGNTPLIKLNKFNKWIKSTIYAARRNNH